MVKIKEVVVVEGKKDTMRVKQAVCADTIETNGSAISPSTLDIIQHAKQKRGVIVFTDPDYPGQRIRHIIDQHIKGCKHAFLPKKEALPTSNAKSIGIEHASIKAIQQALLHVQEKVDDTFGEQIDHAYIMAYGLIGGARSKQLREALGDVLHIGYTNGKQLINRLQMFHITKDELDSAMKHILSKGDQHEL